MYCTFWGNDKTEVENHTVLSIPYYYIYLFTFSIFVLKIYFIFSCMCAWVCMCVFHKHRRLWRSEGVSDLWGLELQAVVKCWTWVLDLTSDFLQEKHIHRTAKPSLRPPKWENEGHLFFKIWIIIFKIQHVIEFFYRHSDLAILRMVASESLHSMSFSEWSGFCGALSNAVLAKRKDGETRS